VRVNGQALDVCSEGQCRGIIDTGTSHLGIPAPYDKEFARLLTRPAGDLHDCRFVEAPEITFELVGLNLTLKPANYMRRLPLHKGVTVSTGQYAEPTSPSVRGAQPHGAAPLATNSDTAAGAAGIERNCSPKLMPVKLPAPLGPHLFILGEPVLQRYYSVYDWSGPRVGFALANSRSNKQVSSVNADGNKAQGSLPKEVEFLLLQESVATTHRGSWDRLQ